MNNVPARRPPVEETSSFLKSLLASHGPDYLEKLFGKKVGYFEKKFNQGNCALVFFTYEKFRKRKTRVVGGSLVPFFSILSRNNNILKNLNLIFRPGTGWPS